MKTKHDRENLLKELEGALALAGPHPRRWQAACCARLSAFIETDEQAARLYAEAKALEKVLRLAPGGEPRPALESCILRAAFQCPQRRDRAAAFETGLGGGAGSRGIRRGIPFRIPGRSFWGEGALLAASLALGVYIGMSGDAVPALRDIDMMASTDGDASMAFSALFDPSSMHDQDQL